MSRRLGSMLASVFLLGNAVALADVTVRECITADPGFGKAYLLPASSGWLGLATLQFNHQTASDYVVSAVVELSEGNTPGTMVEYQLTLDGVAYGWFTQRVAERFRTTQTLRVVIPDVAGGIHTLGVQARNLGTAPTYVSRVWITPMLVNASEVLASASSMSPVWAGRWTDVLTVSSNIPADRMNYLAAYLKLEGGTPGKEMRFRFVRVVGGASTVIDSFTAAAPLWFPDGLHLAFVDRYVSSGAAQYKLQVSGGGTVGPRRLDVLSIPKFTVFEANQMSPVSVPNDDQWHTVSATSWEPLGSQSIGSYGTDGSGFVHATYSGNYDYTGQLQLDLAMLNTGQHFEVGWVEVHPVGHTMLGSLPSDWEQLGNTATHWKVSLLAKASSCVPPGGATMTLAKSRFQVLVLPDNTAYTFHPCPSSTCCTPARGCLAYACSMSGSLNKVNVPAWNCQ